ncbi:MAG: hypothetical protein AABX03_02020 [Nanoarchaeota archaeon]
MNKRGQFYIIAAIVIIAALFGIATVTNYVVTKPDQIRQVQLSEELNLESESIINYGLFNGSDLYPLLENFTVQYAEYLSEDNDIYFVYGDKDLRELHVLSYTQGTQGTVSLSVDGTPTTILINGGIFEDKIEKFTGEVIKVNVAGKDYEFKLNEGQNFFFLIRKPGTQT